MRLAADIVKKELAASAAVTKAVIKALTVALLVAATATVVYLAR